MTCADCKHHNYCIESSRMYPCRDFEEKPKKEDKDRK